MKSNLILIFLFVGFTCLGQDKYTLIENVNIFTGEEYLTNTQILFEADRIIEISDKIKAPRKTNKIDGTGKTIIPPLINAHVHIWMPENLKDALKAGIFANLDLHSNDFFANQLRALNGQDEYSLYIGCNAGATVPKGHGTQFGIPVPTINDTVSAVQFVNDRIEAGADFIKILKEPYFATLSPTQTQEIINATHAAEKVAVSHISKAADAVELSLQRVDGFAHLWQDTIISDSALLILKEAGVFITPTIAVIEKVIGMMASQDYVSKSLNLEQVISEVGRAHQLGIPILCGTDAPNFNLNYTDALFHEMDLLSQAGLSNMEILESATTIIYKAYRLTEFSVLKKDASANFVIVEGDPIKNIKDIRNNKVIYRNGLVIK